MKIEIPIYSERVLSKFVADEWSKVLAFLQKQFGMREEDCQDIFQESFITLYENIQAGKLQELTSSLSTYFIGICRNKAFEAMRRNGKMVTVETETGLTLLDDDIKDDKINAILEAYDDDADSQERVEAIVRQLVRELPHPCDKMLWGFYRDNLSIKQLAEIYGYSEGSAKVTKHRCMEKFSKRYAEFKRNLFD